jgi:hypothetical protein
MEWILFLIFLVDRINRMLRIVSRFPDETVKFTSACGGKMTKKHLSLFFREADCILPVSSGNRQSRYTNNPVNPV